jgi:hypothetical protein
MGYDYNQGRGYIFYGDGSIPTSAGSADKTMTGENAGDLFGFSVSNAGDFNNDGQDDVIIGAPYNDDSGTNAGKAYIYYGGSTYAYVDSNTVTEGYMTNFNNAKSASDSGAYAVLKEELASGASSEETLRPNGAGDKNTWDSGVYTDVNDQSDSTYLESNDATWVESLFATADSSGTGSINWVRVYLRYQRSGGSPGDVFVRTRIKSGSTESTGSSWAPGTSWQESYTEYTQNPDDSQDWEWSDIDSLQIGADGQTAGGRKPQVAEVWLVVNYSAQNYKMDIEFTTTNVDPAANYYLQLNYSVDGTETAFGVLVYDGSSWDDLSAQGDLSSTSTGQRPQVEFRQCESQVHREERSKRFHKLHAQNRVSQDLVY